MHQDESLIELIYEGPIEQDPWASFLHACRLRLHSNSALLMFRTPQDRGEVTDIADSDWHTHAMGQVYYRQYAALNPLDYEHMEAGRTYGFDDFVNEDEFRHSVYYLEHCHPLGIDHALVLFIGEAQGLRAWLNFSRSDSGGAYRPEETAQLLTLAPHLHRALRIYSSLERQRLESLAYRRTGDSLNLATLLMDEHGRIGSMNDSARQLIDSHPSLALRDGRLAWARPDDQRQFDNRLQSLLKDGSAQDYGALAVGVGSPRPLSVLMRRMPRQGADMRHTGAAVVVYLKERGQAAASPKTEIVSTLFGLTPTESRLAVMLADGCSLQEIATALGITEQTARTYSKRIFSKTGASRQSDLVRLVLTSLANLSL